MVQSHTCVPFHHTDLSLGKLQRTAAIQRSKRLFFSQALSVMVGEGGLGSIGANLDDWSSNLR